MRTAASHTRSAIATPTSMPIVRRASREESRKFLSPLSREGYGNVGSGVRPLAAGCAVVDIDGTDRCDARERFLAKRGVANADADEGIVHRSSHAIVALVDLAPDSIDVSVVPRVGNGLIVGCESPIPRPA